MHVKSKHTVFLPILSQAVRLHDGVEYNIQLTRHLSMPLMASFYGRKFRKDCKIRVWQWKLTEAGSYDDIVPGVLCKLIGISDATFSVHFFKNLYSRV